MKSPNALQRTRSFVSIRRHSWLDRLFHMNTTIADLAASVNAPVAPWFHVGHSGRRVTEQQGQFACMNEISETLVYVYIAGAVVTLVLGIWLSRRNGVDDPILLSFVGTSEWLLAIFILLWPLLGPLVIAEIVLRRRRRAKHDSSPPTVTEKDSQ